MAKSKSSSKNLLKDKKVTVKSSIKKSNTNKQKSSNKMTSKKSLKKELPIKESILLEMHDHMLKSRILEERLIKIYKAGDAYFWIGAPGEEAWGVPLGMLAHKGQGPEFDYLHLHYRCTPTLVAMGMTMIDSIRLIMNRATDPSTGGRNFSNHYAFPSMNIMPVTSPIEVQYVMALGTAHVQKRNHSKGITIVSGGDAGTAEGDFASGLIWSSRKGKELPVLITVQNNKWGISTSYDGQHGETFIADRAKAFNIRSRVINGNDPIESYLAIQEEMNYIRESGKPSFIEAKVSRLFGHSSASGANFIDSELDCLKVFQKKLIQMDLITDNEIDKLTQKYEDEGFQAQQIVKKELAPTSESVWDNIYVGNENADWRKF